MPVRRLDDCVHGCKVCETGISLAIGRRGLLQEQRHTKIRAHIRGLQHLYREVLVYLADDLDCVADCEVGVLVHLVSFACFILQILHRCVLCSGVLLRGRLHRLWPLPRAAG